VLIKNQTLRINDDRDTFRDFCFVENVIQANLLATMAESPEAVNQVYNVALNDCTTLNQLYEMMKSLLKDQFPHLQHHRPQYVDFREGDVRHSQADISKAAKMPGFEHSSN